MKKRKQSALFAALLVLALGCPGPGAAGQQTKKEEAQTAPDAEMSAKAAQVMKDLRHRALTAPPEEIGLDKEAVSAKVWLVMMETAFPAGVATLLSFHDGTASLYTTTGGGVLGGYVVREQAQKFVAEAGRHLTRMKPTPSYPYPEVGRIRFYVRTPDGVFTVEAAERELLDRRHALFPLFLAANEVLTGLRKADEKRQPGGR